MFLLSNISLEQGKDEELFLDQQVGFSVLEHPDFLCELDLPQNAVQLMLLYLDLLQKLYSLPFYQSYLCLSFIPISFLMIQPSGVVSMVSPTLSILPSESWLLIFS